MTLSRSKAIMRNRRLPTALDKGVKGAPCDYHALRIRLQVESCLSKLVMSRIKYW